MSQAERKALIEQVRQMSYDELVEYRVNKLEYSMPAILAEQEFERRARVHQHELDLDLLFKQGRWMKFSTIATVAATLIGAILGVLLTFWLQSNPQPKQPESPVRPAQQQSGEMKSIDRTEKAEISPI